MSRRIRKQPHFSSEFRVILRLIGIFRKEQNSTCYRNFSMRWTGHIFSMMLLSFAAYSADKPAENPAPPKPKKTTPVKREYVARLSNDDMSVFSKRFESELWPIMSRGKGDCMHCHDGDGKSQLEIPDENPDTAFKHLLTEDRFDVISPSGILARITSKDPKLKMPPPNSQKPWSDAEVALLRKFEADLKPKLRPDATK